MEVSTAAQHAAGVLDPLPPEIQAAVDRVTEISSLPEITVRVIQMFEDPDATARDMQNVVGLDPALATKILRVVNSAFYGLPAQVGSLDRAILMLGLSAVKNIALAASLSRVFGSGSAAERSAMRNLWRHSVGVAVCARTLATMGKQEATEEAFAAGLVHDVGLIVAHEMFPDKVLQAVNLCITESADYCALERRFIGVDHQALGGALAARWKFPVSLRQVIAFHHAPERVVQECQQRVGTVHVADVLCRRSEFGFWLSSDDEVVSKDLLAVVGITEAQLDQVIDSLPERVREVERVLAE